MTVAANWFEVDKKGLAKLLERRGKAFLVLELLQNAWDQNITEVHVDLSFRADGGYSRLTVTDDDPDGFRDLSHAYTLFAESDKKADPTKRGRFNLGEKLVLSLCHEAEISSTKGTIKFTKEGRQKLKVCRPSGTCFSASLKLTRAEYDEMRSVIQTILPPRTCKTYFDGIRIMSYGELASFEAKLPTEIADAEGNLRPSIRNTLVEIHENHTDKPSMLYEMGIPVVETGDKYHVNIMQKIPLNTDRDNVTPSFLRTVRTLVYNRMFENITEETANEAWVRDATSDERCTKEAMNHALDKRFGEKRVIYDPSDVEANAKAFSMGYTVIKGSQLNKNEWSNVKRDSLALPAGQVTPALPVFNGTAPLIPPHEWTPSMKRVHDYAVALGKELMDVDVTVGYIDTTQGSLMATYAREDHRLIIYARKLSASWFDNPLEVDELLLHEFAHEYCSDHLSHGFHDAICRLAARMKRLALYNPSFFKAGNR